MNKSAHGSRAAIVWEMTDKRKTLKNITMTCPKCEGHYLIDQIRVVEVHGTGDRRAYWPETPRRCPLCTAELGAFMVGE